MSWQPEIGKPIQIRWGDCCTNGVITGVLASMEREPSNCYWYRIELEGGVKIFCDGIEIQEPGK